MDHALGGRSGCGAATGAKFRVKVKFQCYLGHSQPKRADQDSSATSCPCGHSGRLSRNLFTYLAGST